MNHMSQAPCGSTGEVVATRSVELESGLAHELGVGRADVRRMLRLTLLPPRVVEAALAGDDVGSLAGLMRSRAREWR